MMPSVRIKGGESSERTNYCGDMFFETDEQKVITVDCLNYLIQVKKTFQNANELYKYEMFLNIMEHFKSEIIDGSNVVESVKAIFEGHDNLIHGFNAFMPEDFKITASQGDGVSLKMKALKFIEKMKDHFDSTIFISFKHILVDSKEKRKMYYKTRQIFKSQLDLLQEFKEILQIEDEDEMMEEEVKELECDPSYGLVPNNHSLSQICKRLSSDEEEYNPSYKRAPKNYSSSQKCKRLKRNKDNEGGKDDEVLNNSWVQKRIPFDCKPRNSTPDEKRQFKYEEDMYEQHMCMVWITSTLKRVEKALEKVLTSKDDIGFLNEYFSEIHLSCIKMLYDDQAELVIGKILQQPLIALPIVLRRLKQKKEECVGQQLELEEIWTEVFRRKSQEA